MNIPGLFTLAFGLGLLHALDADHIAAVSGLTGHRPSLKNSLRFCLRWAIGHGSVLISFSQSQRFARTRTLAYSPKAQ